MKEVSIERFLSGEVDWSEATPEEMEAGYRAMAADREYEAEAEEWLFGGKPVHTYSEIEMMYHGMGNYDHKCFRFLCEYIFNDLFSERKGAHVFPYKKYADVINDLSKLRDADAASDEIDVLLQEKHGDLYQAFLEETLKAMTDIDRDEKTKRLQKLRKII